ncbi:MAG: Isopropylmalate/citramalate isomerase small subunit [Candidatus Heimdallarchaeota archaeon LC_2]|nr:MAG: Isopropylmalate/citramalate isomerase small subunit [Candidatus Heimdallarchaeota archaeon LC_2]
MSDVDLSNLIGKTLVFGDFMNTDIIIPSQYLEDSDPNIYCKYVMAAERPTTWQEIQDQGETIFVGGIDFGSGSSREQAPDAIRYAGVKAVVAESFATIFFRNCINVGLPLLEVPGITKEVTEGEEIKVNLQNGIVTIISTGKTIQGNKLEPFLLNKLEKGGLIPELQEYVKENKLDQ